MKNTLLPKALLLLATGFALGLSARFFFPAGERVAQTDELPESVTSPAQPTPRLLPTTQNYNPATASENSNGRESGRRPMESRGRSPVAYAPMSTAQSSRHARPPSSRASHPNVPALPPPPAPQIAISSPDADEQVVPIPAGTRLPAVLIDLGQSTDQQASVADQIAGAYLNRGAASDPATPPTTASPQKADTRGNANEPPVWDAAREAADERYRAIFGQDAYIKNTTEAARQALGVK